MFTIMDDDGNISIVEEPSPEVIYTYADYLKWQFEERLELFRGKIFKLSAPNTRHQVIAGKLYYKFRSFLDDQRCHVFIAPFDVRLPVQNRKKDNEITTVVHPDLCVVCDELKIDERGCCGAPNLVIEILSPGNSEKEVRLKFELYEEAGVRKYWIANPVEENIVIFLLDEPGKFSGAKMYTGRDIMNVQVIEGLCIRPADIFKS